MDESPSRKHSKDTFLILARFHMSDEAAKRAVLRYLRTMGFVINRPDWQHGTIQLSEENGQTLEVSLAELVHATRETGVPQPLAVRLDRQDRVFGGTFHMATNSPTITMKMEYAGYSKELRGPCRLAVVESELSDDVLFYRRETCRMSTRDSDLCECCRYYRGYLQSAMSVVDAFVNRYVILGVHHGLPIPRELSGPASMDERLDAWAHLVANTDASILRSGPEWSQYTQLKQERNRMVHAVEPYIRVAIRQLPEYLNAVRLGIGGLLYRMRDFAGESTLGLIERLKTAPKVSFRDLR